MPTIKIGIEDKLAKLACRWWKRIKTTLTRPMQQHLLRFLVLYQEEVGVKFNECVIIKGEAMHRNKVLMSGCNMEDTGEGGGGGEWLWE
jgi:hypothetical protein